MAGELPHELILDILSRLPVTSLIRFRCVSKTWKFLISHSYLVKLHLERSFRNPEILLLLTPPRLQRLFFKPGTGALPFDIARLGSLPFLIQNPILSLDRILQCPKPYKCLIGSCNGLLSLHDSLSTYEYEKHWVCFWNPATNICSRPSPRLCLSFNVYNDMNFGFGYDDRRDSYKVVAMVLDRSTRQTSVWVYCMGDVCWRRSLMFPLTFFTTDNNGYFLNGTVNWIGEFWEESGTHSPPHIFSYDLNNDTCRYLSMPPYNSYGFASMGVLNGCLCLSLHMRRVFDVFALRDVRDETSWSRFMSVSYETLNICLEFFDLRILCMWGDLMLLTYSEFGDPYNVIIIYNSKENRVERTESYYNQFQSFIFSYVPSLILPI